MGRKLFFRILRFAGGMWAITFLSMSVASPLYLNDSLIEAHKGDVEALYGAWIKPIKTGSDIPVKSDKDLEELVKDIIVGFDRFCAASGGTVSHPEISFSYSNLCTAKDGTIIGSINTQTMIQGRLVVWYATPKDMALAEMRKKEFKERMELNGPIGWLITDKGNLPFLRIGTLSGRDVVDIAINGKYIPIEEVSKIDFHKPCCDMTVYFKDGQTTTLNVNDFRHRLSLSSTTNYSSGKFGIPFVMIDTAQGKLYEQLFSIFQDIQTIKIDPENDWKGKSGAALQDLAIYHAMSKATTQDGLIKFIETYKNNDPEGLVIKAKKQIPILRAEEAKLVARERKELAQKNAIFREAVTSFRRIVKVGDDSHCGLVIELKRPLIKIQTIAGERWFKISQIYPEKMASCNFYNNTYQDPIGLPL